MKITANNTKIWKDLFQAATDFRDLAPWRWMYDADLFGVKDPATGEVGWCCIMGAGGEVFALGVYLGTEGYATYQKLAESQFHDYGESDTAALVLDQIMLKVEFVDRNEMHKTDLEAFKKLGLKFRGSLQWVQAREMMPGYLPWFLSDEQAVFMTHCLQQAMEVAKEYHQNERYLEDGNEGLLVMSPTQTGKKLAWQPTYVPEPEVAEPPARQVSPMLVNRAKKELERKQAAICFSLDYVPSPILSGEGETQPFFAKMALWIVYGSGYILGTKIFSPKNFAKEFDPAFFGVLHQCGIIPEQLIVNSYMAADMVEPIAEALGMEMIYEPELQEFKDVREGMMGRFF